MIQHRPFETLGRIERDWLQARLHFRFGDIGRPEHAPVGPLFIWNDDTFAPHSGFGMHAHENVEIITFVRPGAITHEDSVGNTARIETGDVQVMSAGGGIRHAERNDESEAAQLFQIWLTPRHRSGEPCWAQRRFGTKQGEGFVIVASGAIADVGAGALPLDADARVMIANMRRGEYLARVLPNYAQAYLVSTTGRLQLNDVHLAARDGAAVSNEAALSITALDDTSIVMLEALAACEITGSSAWRCASAHSAPC